MRSHTRAAIVGSIRPQPRKTRGAILCRAQVFHSQTPLSAAKVQGHYVPRRREKRETNSPAGFCLTTRANKESACSGAFAMGQNATSWLPRFAKMLQTAGLQLTRSCMGCQPNPGGYGGVGKGPFTHAPIKARTERERKSWRERERTKKRETSDTIRMCLLVASRVPTH